MPSSDGDRNPRVSGSGGEDNGDNSNSRRSRDIEQRLNSNPFIRFKNHIDDNIHRGFELWASSLRTLPSSLDGFGFPRSEHHQSPTSPTSPATTRALSRDASSSTDPAPSTTGLDRSPNEYDTNVRAGDAGDPWHATEIDDVYRWAAHSPYSPLHLQHLRQPVPRDGPRYYRFSFTFPPWSSSQSPNHTSPDSSLFTFRDAFEDLLLVSSGYAPADLNGILAARFFEDEYVGNSGAFGLGTREGQHVATWTAKLGQLGLWHSFFPHIAASSGAHSSPGSYDRDATLPLSSDWLAARRRWLSYLEDSPTLASACQRFRFRPAAQMSGEWERIWDWGQRESGSNEWSSRRSNSNVDKSSHTAERNAAPETSSSELASKEDQMVEDDLYSFIAASEFTPRGDQQQGEATTTVDKSSLQEPTTSETTETTNTWDGGKIIKTVCREDDKAKGRTKTTTKTERYDAEGNLVSQGNSTSTTWSSSSSWHSSSGSIGRSSETTSSGSWSEEEDKRSKAGWFWTR